MSLQPAHHVVTPQHHMVVKQCLEELGEWRAFIIGVDGWTGSGKSTLARVLAWQLEMPCIETDLFLTGNGWGHYDWDTLGRLVAKRLDHSSSGRSAGRPVIVEGVGLLHILKTLGRQADFLIQVQNESRAVCDSEDYERWMEKYQADHQPGARASFVFRWSDT